MVAFLLYTLSLMGFDYLNIKAITHQNVEALNNISNTPHLSSLLLGMFFGLMIAMAIYNLLLYFSLRDKAYILYVGTTVFAILTIVSIYKLGDQYFWPNSPGLDAHIYVTFAGISMFFSSRFAAIFLKLKELNKGLNKFMWLIASLSLLLTTLSLFLTIEQITPFGRWLVLLSFPSYIITAIIAYKKGFKPAKFYIIAWVPYVIGLITRTMHGAGWLPNNQLVISSIELGAAFEIVLLSFALAYRIKGMKKELAEKELEKAQLRNKLITEHNIQLEKTVEERTKDLKEANTIKDKFFAIIAHDLRSSVTSFKGIGKIINSYSSKNNVEKVSSLSKKMDNASDQLSAFLDNLLNWSFTQLNNVPYHPNDINLISICNREIEFKQALADSKEITIRVTGNQDINAFADANGVGLIIGNLINNAIKFTPLKGEITLAIKRNNNWAIIDVIDNGVGMNPEQTESLFALKRHNTSKGTEGEKGSGLGLILCKEFTDLNKGKISIKSKMGKGTLIKIKLPLTK